MFTKATLTSEETSAMEVARVGFMTECPFFSHYFYSEMLEHPTRDIPTAGTDGRRIYYNPGYLAGLKPPERIFVLAHEVFHAISRHPQRAKHYEKDGKVQAKPFDQQQANIAMDYTINAGLMEQGIGMMNPSWLFDPNVTGDDLWEDVYQRTYKKPPTTFGGSGKAPRGAKGDKAADGNGGRFDEVLEPQVDPVTGAVDLPGDAEFKEAIARAVGAAKAMGKMPESLQRMVDGILEPQIDWREHVRMLITGKLGHRRETWERADRRRLALNPIVVLPGRSGHGAGTVACVVDNSGSIGDKELSAWFAEISGIMADVRPKEIVLIWCDARVQQVDRAANMDELTHIRCKGAPGGGGTSFIPPFEWLVENQIRPDALIYLTDMMGTFPSEKPNFDVIWCASMDLPAPWGDVVRVKVE